MTEVQAMTSIINELKKIDTRKNVVTSIEYECPNQEKEDEVFDTVREILFNDLDAFSKITYDIDPADHKIKVEVIQHLQ